MALAPPDPAPTPAKASTAPEVEENERANFGIRFLIESDTGDLVNYR